MATTSDEQIKDEIIQILESEERFFSDHELANKLNLRILFPSMLESPEVESIIVKHEAVNGANKTIDRLYCSKWFFYELISEIAFEALSKFEFPKALIDLRSTIRYQLATYLGLSQNELELIDTSKLGDILDSDDRFIISHKSSFELGKNNLVALKSWEEKLYKSKRFVLDTINILASNSGITLKKLLFKLNLSNYDYGLVKPYTTNTFIKVMQFEGNLFHINDDKIEIRSLNERIEDALKQKKKISHFRVGEHVSGLLILSYIGNNFPIAEAKEYVELRPMIFFLPIFSISLGFREALQQFEILIRKIFDLNYQNIDDWMNENLAVSFVIEDYDYLKLNFDKLMQEYSPVLNLEKNPGNLFRGIIEEKLREYENGKES